MSELVTIVELENYLRDVAGILTEDEQEELKVHLAAYPEAGVIIPGSSGIRKLRWGRAGVASAAARG